MKFMQLHENRVINDLCNENWVICNQTNGGFIDEIEEIDEIDEIAWKPSN